MLHQSLCVSLVDLFYQLKKSSIWPRAGITSGTTDFQALKVLKRLCLLGQRKITFRNERVGSEASFSTLLDSIAILNNKIN